MQQTPCWDHKLISVLCGGRALRQAWWDKPDPWASDLMALQRGEPWEHQQEAGALRISRAREGAPACLAIGGQAPSIPMGSGKPGRESFPTFILMCGLRVCLSFPAQHSILYSSLYVPCFHAENSHNKYWQHPSVFFFRPPAAQKSGLIHK